MKNLHTTNQKPTVSFGVIVAAVVIMSSCLAGVSIVDIMRIRNHMADQKEAAAVRFRTPPPYFCPIDNGGDIASHINE